MRFRSTEQISYGAFDGRRARRVLVKIIGDRLGEPSPSGRRQTQWSGYIVKPKLVAFLTLALLIGFVIFQNTEVVTFHFLFWHLSMSRILLLTFAVLTGFAMGALVAKLPKGGDKRK